MLLFFFKVLSEICCDYCNILCISSFLLMTEVHSHGHTPRCNQQKGWAGGRGAWSGLLYFSIWQNRRDQDCVKHRVSVTRGSRPVGLTHTLLCLRWTSDTARLLACFPQLSQLCQEVHWHSTNMLVWFLLLWFILGPVAWLLIWRAAWLSAWISFSSRTSTDACCFLFGVTGLCQSWDCFQKCFL